jgi:hypothetical protein
MPDHEAPGRAVYDHSNDEPRSGRRRRQVSDWGVGEEIFDHMPGPRFARERRPGGHSASHGGDAIPRGGADDGRRTIVIEHDGEETPIEAPPRPEESYASREEAITARREHDLVWAGDEPFADESAADEGGDEALALDEPAEMDDRSAAASDDDPYAGAPLPDGIARGGVEGRRTVKIGGRPPEFYPARRPPRAVHDRLGPRPDRIAAWAFALGLLLILIAILTQ